MSNIGGQKEERRKQTKSQKGEGKGKVVAVL
jgi:hypothetical protein